MVRKNAGRKNDSGHAVSDAQEFGPTPVTEASAQANDNQAVTTEAAPAEAQTRELSFPIVGIGASAGGLAAFESFFENMPADTESGIAFVLVQHLDPSHKSILTELVRHYTQMRVFEVEDGVTIEPNCAYIIPPNKDMTLRNGQLHLTEPSAPRGLRLPIDFFFRSLAQDRGEQAICIVLSGTGTDGTLGLKAIKEAGGMVMVQESESATYDGMPRSAIATGLADYILPVKELPAQLIAYVQKTFGKKRRPVVIQPSDFSSWIQRILILLRSHSGHDFSSYKQSTIRRRIERRMVVNQIDRMEQYLQFLRQNYLEVEMLFRELLIGVTGFFRDPAAFEALRDKVIPRLFTKKPKENLIRVWVPGCSTGEEAYSIAMLLEEFVEKIGRPLTIQVFATDIDHEAIEKARVGLYPSSIAADVAPDRLARFFTQEEDAYHINKSIRDLVVFADQDMIKDPPFSKIDLLSCRNLLIYWEHDLQRKIFPLFHYSLRPGGFLFLGSSETVGEFSNLFEAVDRKWKIYHRKEGISLSPFAELEIPPLISSVLPSFVGEGQKEKKTNVRDVTERMLIHDYAPVSVMVDSRGEIIYVHGHTGKYLELPIGEINTNILRAVREGLRLELTTALRKAVAHSEIVRLEGLQIITNGSVQWINLVVKPVSYPTLKPGMFLIVFEDIPTEPETEKSTGKSSEMPGSEKDHQIVALERELRTKEEYLQTTIEELETANEELKSTNEELQSTNEELQSTNEELETSKEELQSVNEELVTVNNELQQKIDEQSRLNNDMNNLLAGTGIATVFVDMQRSIVRFTPAITRIINLIQGDVGRPLSHIASNLVNYNRLEEDTQAVIDTLVPRETEVQIKNGLWFILRIMPYRTTENVIEGAVITFVEITRQKTLQDTYNENEERFKSILENSDSLIWSINTDYHLTLGNTAFFINFRDTYQREVKLGDVMPPEWMPVPLYEEWKARYQRALSGKSFREIVTVPSASGEKIIYEYAFNPILEKSGGVACITCIGRDITGHKRASQAHQRLDAAQRDASEAIIVHDLKGHILEWNPAAARMFGWSDDMSHTKGIMEMVAKENRPELEAALEMLAQGRPVEPFETRQATREGKAVKVFWTFADLVDESGKPYAAAANLREITPPDA